MDLVTINASPRMETGKAANKRLRRENRIPAIAYGRGQTPQSLTISPKDLSAALKGPWGNNVVVEVKVGEDKAFPALVADYTYHPVTRVLWHADFLMVDLNEPVEVEVPLTTTGKSQGVVEGGVLRQVFRVLPIRCLPTQVPQKLELDVTSLKQNESAKVSDLVLPEGVSVRLPANQSIVTVMEAASETAEAGAEGAAPAADAKKEAGKKDGK